MNAAKRSEEVIAQLKRDAKRSRPGAERSHAGGVCVCEDATELSWPASRIATGLQIVHALDVEIGHEVELLPCEDLFLDPDEKLQRLVSSAFGKAASEQQLPSEGRREISGEDPEACAQMIASIFPLERVVNGRTSAAFGVLVHPVVVNQQIGLEQLQGGAGFERRADVEGPAGSPKGCGRDDRPKPFSAAHRQVANLGDQLDRLRRKPSRFFALRSKKPLQDGIDLLTDDPHPRLEIHLFTCHGVSVPIPSYVHGRTLPSKRCDERRH